MTDKTIYIIGGHQTDFSRNWAREGLAIYDLFAETVTGGLAACALDAKDIEVGHVGNFEGSLYTGQSHLGGFFGHVDPALRYLPASRHEAACASGSMALFAAMADLESGRYDLACVIGIELMRAQRDGEDRLKGAAWVGKEWVTADLVWPAAFSDLVDVYEDRYGLQREHLAAISQKNFGNAKRNPNSQSRAWSFPDGCFLAEDDRNPEVSGNIRKLDCGQVTDGGAVVFLANRAGAENYCHKRGLKLESLPRIKGWAHVNAPMLFEEKVRLGGETDFPFPHVRQLFEQALARAGLDLSSIDGIELHDCFNITEYMVLDHLDLKPRGEVWQAIEEGRFESGGSLPVNMSGGLIGLGHPVGATGVRMALDCYKQVSDQAGDMQIEGASNMMTFNLGGTTTTCASIVVGT